MIHVCPTEVFHAPPERVWELIAVPRHYPSWTTLHLLEAPDRPVEAGDRIVLSKFSNGRVKVVFEILACKPMEELTIDAFLPTGVVNHEVMRLTRISDEQCRLTFN